MKLTPEQRIEYIKEIQQIWMDEAPFTMLYQNQTIAAMDKDLQGYAYHPSLRMKLYTLSK